MGGWDTLNALADMPVQNAVILDNWFPSTDKVTLRKGYTSHATGMSGDVETLLAYTPATGTGVLFAANGGNIFDVTAAGAVGAAVVSGKSNGRWQQTQITSPGGHFLFAVNGTDTPQTYDGSAWADSTITGPTIANLIWANNHQRRLWFGEKDSLTAYYLAVNSIAGAATAFPLGGLASLGGYIMAMGTWSRDSGAGADDAAVFLTSEGEAVVYAGTDPASAATWSLVGVFRIGKPIGRRCMIKLGADLVIVTQDGFVAASQILLADRSQAETVAISQQINKAVNDAVQAGSSLFGWQPFIYPKGTMLLFNIPDSSVEAEQFVFNTITRAPCRFTGINAACWALLNDAPYFGGQADGTVYKFDDGFADNNEAIAADALQAFNDFGSPGANKRFTLVEPIFQSNGAPSVALNLNVDYQVRRATAVASTAAETSAKWGISKWGIGLWGSASQTYRGWRGIRGIGRSASLRVRISSSVNQPSWLATNWLITPGGPL
ncbi:MAG: hypothetical protein O2782_18930 [bacterium]|nr:hypothetical protein [bacterium]